MTDDSVTGEWPAVARDGEPELKRGPAQDSLEPANEYWIRTTPIPDGAQGTDWLGFFNSQLGHDPPCSGYHDGNQKIIVDCWPDSESKLTETVDSAIEYANEQLRASTSGY